VGVIRFVESLGRGTPRSHTMWANCAPGSDHILAIFIDLGPRIGTCRARRSGDHPTIIALALDHPRPELRRRHTATLVDDGPAHPPVDEFCSVASSLHPTLAPERKSPPPCARPLGHPRADEFGYRVGNPPPLDGPSEATLPTWGRSEPRGLPAFWTMGSRPSRSSSPVI